MALTGLLWLAGSAHAQPSVTTTHGYATTHTAGPTAPDESAGQAMQRAQGVLDGLDGALRCLRDVRTRVAKTLELLRQARDQAAESPPGSDVHRDAQESVVSLSQQLPELAKQARACEAPDLVARARKPATRRSRRPVEAVEAPAAPPTRVIEQDAPLADGLSVVVAEQVDGHGLPDDADLKRAIRGIARRLARCYVPRRDLGPHEVSLAFTLTPTGRLRDISVEGTGGVPPTLRGCVARAARTLGTRKPTVGGNATISYTLRFAPR